MSDKRLLLGNRNQITISIPIGYDVSLDILPELMRYWTSSDDDYNWFDIPLPLSETLKAYLEQETLSK
jgi:hypothetical protein